MFLARSFRNWRTSTRSWRREALDQLLHEEVTLRETRRIKAVLMLARLTAIKTLAGFDFVFQPSPRAS